MKIILVYDIELKEQKDQKRLNNIKKIARKYLYHVQKSVFEGELTEAKLYAMKKEILEHVDKYNDSIILYIVPDAIKIRREVINPSKDKTSNII